MGLNLKNAEVERLATEVARLTNESKTEAIRKALLERKARITASSRRQKRSERVATILNDYRADLKPGLIGHRMKQNEEDDILGFGSGGV